MKRKYSLLVSLLLVWMSLNAKVQLPSLISDNMVLQQQTDVKLWGMAKPNSLICVSPSWDKQTYNCHSDELGRWMLNIPTPQGGFTLHSILFDDGEQTTVSNIMVGEVWLASGQSNMEMPVKGFVNCPIKDATETMLFAGESEGVRVFNVPHVQEFEPQNDCKGNWSLSSPMTVSEFSAAAYHFAFYLSRALNVPVGILNCAYGGSKVESWTDRELLETYDDISLHPDSIRKGPAYLRPMMMYNGMLHPLHNYTIRGFIWYQGESNVGKHSTYAQRLANMVQMWRNKWGLGELPFYYAEIAPYVYGGSQKDLAPYLREAQYKAQDMIPNSAMFSTNDLVEPFEKDNIHPSNKKEVGKRFALLALNLTYGMKNIGCYGPEYKEIKISGNEVHVSFKHIEMGYSRNRDIQGFEVADADRNFYPADSVRVDWRSRQVVVSSGKVAHPIAVRYCFRDFQIGNMGGMNGLPMVPFRTDDW